MKQLKKYIQSLSETDVKNLFAQAKLTELEYWVLYYGTYKKRLVENTCMKLNISRAYYFILQGKGLIKIYYTINKS